MSKKLSDKIKEIETKGAAGLEKIQVSLSLEENRKVLNEVFKNCSDIFFREFRLGDSGLQCFAVFFSEMVDKNTINQGVLKQLMCGCSVIGLGTKDPKILIDTIRESVISAGEILETKTVKDAVGGVMDGSFTIFVEGLDTAFVVKVSDIKVRSVSDPIIEQTIRGPQEGFVESLDNNLALIRKRLKTPELKTESHILGTKGNTKLIIAYMNGIADGDIIKEAKKRISEINIDILPGIGALRAYIEDDPLSPFPQFDHTERPDVCVAGLAAGRIAFFMDGGPFVLLAPTTFPYLFNEPEDYFDKVYYASFARVLRYMAFFIALLGPSLYIAITTFQPEMIPQSLLISILTSRSDVPFPAVLEAILMELIFEIIREVSIRLPKNMGQSLSIVGGLVIGQLSVQAGIVSPIMIIVVAATGLSSFLIPKLNTMRQISIMRFPMMLLAAFFGIFGLIMGGLFLLIHLVSLRSLGVPYLTPFAPFDITGLKDTIIRLPLTKYTKRPDYIQNNNISSQVPPERLEPNKNN